VRVAATTLEHHMAQASKSRPTIARMMIGIGFVALGLAAVRNASDVWVGVIAIVTCAILAVATLRARFGPDDRRDSDFVFACLGFVVLFVAKLTGENEWPFNTPNWFLIHVVKPRDPRLGSDLDYFQWIKRGLAIASTLESLVFAYCAAWLYRVFSKRTQDEPHY
jgi:hypothetical protein